MDNTPDPTPNDGDRISKCRVYNSTDAGSSWIDREGSYLYHLAWIGALIQ